MSAEVNPRGSGMADGENVSPKEALAAVSSTYRNGQTAGVVEESAQWIALCLRMEAEEVAGETRAALETLRRRNEDRLRRTLGDARADEAIRLAKGVR